MQDTTYTSEFPYTLPARIFSAERGRERYVMTVLDYNGIEAGSAWRPARRATNAAGVR